MERVLSVVQVVIETLENVKCVEMYKNVWRYEKGAKSVRKVLWDLKTCESVKVCENAWKCLKMKDVWEVCEKFCEIRKRVKA